MGERRGAWRGWGGAKRGEVIMFALSQVHFFLTQFLYCPLDLAHFGRSLLLGDECPVFPLRSWRPEAFICAVDVLLRDFHVDLFLL